MDRQNSDDIMKFLDGMASSDDVLFGFLDEGNQSLEDYPDSGNFAGGEESDADNDAAGCNSEENKTFWHEQEQLLQVTFILVNSKTILVSSLIKVPILFLWGLINFVLVQNLKCVGDTV